MTIYKDPRYEYWQMSLWSLSLNILDILDVINSQLFVLIQGEAH